MSNATSESASIFQFAPPDTFATFTDSLRSPARSDDVDPVGPADREVAGVGGARSGG